MFLGWSNNEVETRAQRKSNRNARDDSTLQLNDSRRSKEHPRIDDGLLEGGSTPMT